MDEPSDNNSHITAYLEYYASLTYEPHYAVMVNGPWGIGKTFIVKRFMTRRFKPEERVIYVSLYGIQSLEQIDTAILHAIYPILGSKTAKIAGHITKALLGRAGIESDIRITDVLAKAEASLFVFDDLERCAIPVDTVLGYINELVEHDGQKVVIIANEAEIDKKDKSYQSRREKLIGKTLDVLPSFNDAFRHFCSQITDQKARVFLVSNVAQVADIYRKCGLDNLRLLQQTMWDFERVYAALEDQYRDSEVAVTTIVDVIFALSFELKAGRISREDIASRSTLINPFRGSDPPSPIAALAQRYSGVRVADALLPDALLVDILVKGVVDRGDVNSALANSYLFVKREDEASWRGVWHFLERTDAEFRASLMSMDKDLSDKRFAQPGEILHAFGLRLWLAGVGIAGDSRGSVVTAAKEYIDSIYSAGRLPPTPFGEVDDVRFGYGGLSFHEAASPEFGEISRYLKQRRDQAASDLLPREATSALAMLRENPDLFGRYVRGATDSGVAYTSVPLLASMSEEAFVATFLALSPAEQRSTLWAINARYEHGLLYNDLSLERPWLEGVVSRINEATESMSAESRYRIRTTLGWTLETTLRERDQAAPPQKPQDIPED